MGIWGVVGMGGHNVGPRSGIASWGIYDRDPGEGHPTQELGKACDFCNEIAPYINYNSLLDDQIYVNYKALKGKLRNYEDMSCEEISKIVNDVVKKRKIKDINKAKKKALGY